VETITRLVANWEASTAIQAQLEKNIERLTVGEAELQEKMIACGIPSCSF
jgi:hypothetical protein